MAQSFFIYQDPPAIKPFTAFWGPGVEWTLHQVRIHLSAAAWIVENLTIRVDGGYVAAVYDTLLLTQPMNGVSDVVYTPAAPIHLGRLDEVDIIYANSCGLLHGVEIVFSTRE